MKRKLPLPKSRKMPLLTSSGLPRSPPYHCECWETAYGPKPDRGIPSAMPVFYRRPRPLNATQDAGKSLARAGNFLFARGTNSVALNGPEFPQAMRTYPIVFTTGEPRTAVAVLGLRDNENLFLDSAGSWRPDSYIPAYVRRYPFVFMVQPGNADMVLCIDDDSGLLVEDDTRPLFVDGKPTDVVQHALRFCAEFQA